MTRRFYSKILLFVTVGSALALKCQAEDVITWGVANHGLRLGLAADLASNRFRLVLRNTSPTTLDVLVGFTSGERIAYAFTFTGTAPDGTKQRIWDVRPESMTHVAGFLAPHLIGIAPASTHEFAYPLSQLVYMAKGRTVPVDNLLRSGYAVSVMLAVQQKELDEAVMRGIPQPLFGRLWTGLVTCEIPATKVSR